MHIFRRTHMLIPALVLALLFGSPALAAEDEARDSGDQRADLYSYAEVLYDSNNGMPTSSVNDVVQDSRGFIWVAGYSGLLRYDGREFTRFDSCGISSVRSLLVDSAGRLWIGSNDNGLALYADNRFSYFPTSGLVQSDYVRTLAEDGAGFIYAGTNSGLLYAAEDSRGGLLLHTVRDRQVRSARIMSLCPAADGRVACLTGDNVLLLLKGGQVLESHDLSAETEGSLKTVAASTLRPGCYYVGDDESTLLKLYLYGSGYRCERLSAAPLVNINDLMESSAGRLWITADNGIGYYENNRFYKAENLDMNSLILSAMEDYEGNLWFASSRQGLLKITRTRFVDISAGADLPDVVVNATALFQGLLYVATDSGLYLIKDHREQAENELTELLRGVRVRCLQVREDALWICSHGDSPLIRYGSDGQIRIWSEQDGLAGNKARSVEFLNDGRVAVATSAGVTLLNAEGQVLETYAGAGGAYTETQSLCATPEGDLYMGTNGGGVNVLTAQGEFYNIDKGDGLKSDVVVRLRQDPNRGGLWALTSRGLCYIGGNGRITEIECFPYRNNLDIFILPDDSAWILASNGVYATTAADLLDGGKLNYRFYNVEDGLPYYATASSFSYLSPDQVLYLAGSNGVCCFSLKMSGRSGAVKLAVPQVSVDDQIHYVGEGQALTIPSSAHRLTFSAYVLSYSFQNQVISYWLEGFDKEPNIREKNSLGDISYTNLPGGSYTFHLAALDSGTRAVVNEITVELNKELKPLEMPAVVALLIGLSVAAALSINYFLYRMRMHQLRRENQRNKDLSNQIIHAFARVIDAKDGYTNGHSHRVAKYTAALAERLGMNGDELQNAYNIALLHDVGKVAVPDAVLNKPGLLTEEEYGIMKIHPVVGNEILAGITVLPEIALGAYYHHERPDGRGYANGLTGDEIPVVARMIAVADAFDAMNTDRPYRKRLTREKIIRELRDNSGTQFDPEIARAMLSLIEDGTVPVNSDKTPAPPGGQA